MGGEPEILYRPRGRMTGYRVGAHASRGIGSLGEFRDQVPFMVHPDARRIDVRASLRNPFGTTFVRRSRPRVSLDLYAIVDLTASLRFEGRSSKQAQTIELCTALASSATRGGDRFGIIGCDETVRDDCFLPASGRPGVAAAVQAALRVAPRDGTSAAGLPEAAERLTGRRKLVFLISDFFLALDLLRRTFENLAGHDVVAVVIADSAEDEALPDWGLLDLVDLESGRTALVAMRPTLKRRWIEERLRHAEAVRRLAAQFGRTPVTITDLLDIDDFSRQLLES